MVCYHINEKLSTMGYGSIFHNLLNPDLIRNKNVNNRSTLSTVYVSIICRQQVGSECKHLLCKQVSHLVATRQVDACGWVVHSETRWLCLGQEFNENVLPIDTPSILHGDLWVAAGSLWQNFAAASSSSSRQQVMENWKFAINVFILQS